VYIGMFLLLKPSPDGVLQTVTVLLEIDFVARLCYLEYNISCIVFCFVINVCLSFGTVSAAIVVSSLFKINVD
jgi:integral membrane sensor domain MASE1